MCCVMLLPVCPLLLSHPGLGPAMAVYYSIIYIINSIVIKLIDVGINTIVLFFGDKN